MTDLYALRVLALEPNTRRVRLRVFELYDEGRGFDYECVTVEDASFFLRVLWDEADTRFGGGPLGEVVSLDEVLDEGWVDNHTWRFIDRYERVADYNVPFTDAERARQPKIAFSGRWFSNEEWLVQSDFDVWVTDSRWLDHLTLGQQWTTAAYSTRAVYPAAGRDRPALSPDATAVTDVQRFDPMETNEDRDVTHVSFASVAMRELAEASAPVTDAEFDGIRNAHREWLGSGGGYGHTDLDGAWSPSRGWQVLNASGYAIAVFEGPQGTVGTQASLRNRMLAPLDLRRVELPWADLTAVLAQEVDLSGSNLVGSALTDSHLCGIDLSGAHLAWADFSRSDLRGANLSGADLSFTDFENADLAGADFTGARVIGVNLRGANVDGIRGFATGDTWAYSR